jgi:tRNA uridine 5-carboxymethylaminomethyl modification enzyme
LEKILKRPQVGYASLPSKDPTLPTEVIEQVEIQVKYSGYLDRQATDVQRLKSLEKRIIPDGFDYDSIKGLRVEARQKFASVRPVTIGQASRISGVSPADISLLSVWVQRALSQTK